MRTWCLWSPFAPRWSDSERGSSCTRDSRSESNSQTLSAVLLRKQRTLLEISREEIKAGFVVLYIYIYIYIYNSRDVSDESYLNAFID